MQEVRKRKRLSSLSVADHVSLVEQRINKDLEKIAQLSKKAQDIERDIVDIVRQLKPVIHIVKEHNPKLAETFDTLLNEYAEGKEEDGK